jgi:hypothetical protein
MSKVLELFAGSFLLCPAFALSIPDSLSSGGTHLAALLRGRRCSCLLGSITEQQSTGLFELGNLGINRSENFVYSHAKSISNLIPPLASRGVHRLLRRGLPLSIPHSFHGAPSCSGEKSLLHLCVTDCPIER